MYIPQVIRRMSISDWGGTESVVLNTTRHLRKNNVLSEILATQAMDTRSESVYEGVPLKRFPYFYPYLGLSQQGKSQLDRKGGNPMAPALVRYLKNHQPQLIHGHSMQRMAGMVRQAAQSLNVPYVLSFHGGYFDVPQAEIQQMVLPVRRRLHYGRLLDPCLGYHRALADATGLICVNPLEAEKMQAQYPRQRVCYLPNGVELQTPETEKASADRFRQQHGIPPELPLLLCIGRIDAQKGQHEALNFLAQSETPVGLVCIGPVTDPDYAQRLKSDVIAKGLSQRVWLLPGLPPEHQSLADARAAAQICIVPSRHEPFGIVVLEAWRQRLPVVANAVGGLNTLITPGKNGYKADLNGDFWPRVQQLLKDPETQQRLGNGGYDTVEKHYTWHAVTQTLMAFYEQCMQDFYAPPHQNSPQNFLTKKRQAY